MSEKYLNERLPVRSILKTVCATALAATPHIALAVGMGSSVAFEGSGGGGDKGLIFGLYVAFLLFAWIGGTSWALLAYAPPLIGTPVVMLFRWMVTGQVPWDYRIGQLIGVLFVGHLIGLAVFWYISNRKSEAPSE